MTWSRWRSSSSPGAQERRDSRCLRTWTPASRPRQVSRPMMSSSTWSRPLAKTSPSAKAKRSAPTRLSKSRPRSTIGEPPHPRLIELSGNRLSLPRSRLLRPARMILYILIGQKFEDLAKLHAKHLTDAPSDLANERREIQPPEIQRKTHERPVTAYFFLPGSGRRRNDPVRHPPVRSSRRIPPRVIPSQSTHRCSRTNFFCLPPSNHDLKRSGQHVTIVFGYCQIYCTSV